MRFFSNLFGRHFLKRDNPDIVGNMLIAWKIPLNCTRCCFDPPTTLKYKYRNLTWPFRCAYAEATGFSRNRYAIWVSIGWFITFEMQFVSRRFPNCKQPDAAHKKRRWSSGSNTKKIVFSHLYTAQKDHGPIEVPWNNKCASREGSWAMLTCASYSQIPYDPYFLYTTLGLVDTGFQTCNGVFQIVLSSPTAVSWEKKSSVKYPGRIAASNPWFLVLVVQ